MAAALPGQRKVDSGEQSAELGRVGDVGREEMAALVVRRKAGYGLAWIMMTTSQVYRKLARAAQLAILF